MKAYIQIKFNKPPKAGTILDVRDDFKVLAGGKEYTFGFCVATVESCDGATSLFRFELEDDNLKDFPDMIELRKHLSEITEILELPIYASDETKLVDIEENDVDGLRLEKIVEFTIESCDEKVKEVPDSTPSVSCDVVGSMVALRGGRYGLSQEMVAPIVAYSLQDRLLEKYVSGKVEESDLER